MTDPSFALPLSKLGAPNVAVSPTGGFGLALDFNGKVPSSALSVPRTFTRTIASGPPPSPIDTDIWIATTVDANGARWAFQYNAGSASSFKWEFIGGAPIKQELGGGAAITGMTQVGATGWFGLTTAGRRLTMPRAGDYLFTASVWAAANAAAGQFGASIGNWTQVIGSAGNSRRDTHLDATENYANINIATVLTVAISDVMGITYSSSNTANGIQTDSLFVIPVRVS